MSPLSLLLLPLFAWYHALATDDLITRTTISRKFMSVGYTNLDDSGWKSVTTPNTEFLKPVIVILGLPNIPGQTSSDGYPAVPKMQGVATKNGDGSYTFAAKIVQANDSYCSKQWRTPTKLTSAIQVSWIVVEQGAWLIDGNRFITGEGTVTRASGATTATTANGNLNTIFYPVGCNATSPTENCKMSMTNRGAVGQVMTNNNVKQPGIDMFLSVRGKSVNERQTGWVLIPHDASDPNYFVLSAETLGYIIFATGITARCVEGFFMEFSANQVNFLKTTMTFQYQYNYYPGIFGTIGTVTSMVDATTLRTFDRTFRQASFITQEDQCVDQETDHTTFETVYLFVVGESYVNATGNSVCDINYISALAPTASPTIAPSRPTSSPTFQPSRSPTRAPTISFSPSFQPSVIPSLAPSVTPSFSPSSSPSETPSSLPTSTPTNGGQCATGPNFNLVVRR
jgi:hypothetical protein